MNNIQSLKPLFEFISSTLKLSHRHLLKCVLSTVFIGLGVFLVEVLFVNELSALMGHVGMNLSVNNRLAFLNSIPLDQLVWIVGGTAIIRAFLQFLNYWLPGMTRQLFILSIRKNLVPYVLHNPNKRKHSDLLAIYNEHLNNSSVIYQVLPKLFSDFVALLLYSLYLLKLNALFFIMGASIFAVFFIPLRVLGKYFVVYSERLSIASDLQYSLIHTGLKNYFFLELYSKIESERLRALKILSHVIRTFNRYYIFSGLKMNLPSPIGVGIVCFLIYWNQSSSHPIPASVLVTFFYLFMRMSNSLGDIFSSLNQLPLSISAGERITLVAKETLDFMRKAKESSHLGSQKVPLLENSFELKLEAASFKYSNETPRLGPYDLSVKTGQCFTLKGPSGSGKSTMLGILLGIYNPQSGSATINGIDLQKVRESFSNFISYVGPEPYLIPGTLRENLLYCNEEFKIDDKKIWKYLEKVGLADFFHARPQQLDEKLSDLAELSTGQRQRIALCRAFLREAPILVLDEATANLDAATEAQILLHLKEIKAQTLMLISTHKDVFDPMSDRIFDLSNKAK